MPDTFDISQTPPAPGPGAQRGQPQRSHGFGTAAEEIARKVFGAALCILLVLVGYFMWGLLSFAWAGPDFGQLDKPTQARQIDNINLIMGWIWIVAVICVVSAVICSFRDEGIGYFLALVAAIVYLGLPYLIQMVYGWTSHNPTPASTSVLSGLAGLWWLFGVPGGIFILVDLVRRFQSASETASIQRAKLKYGASIEKQTSSKQRQVFLGRCWELPYCRDHVRQKCPIYIRRKGPCWWYKEGCMCEQRIVLQAVISDDWKKNPVTDPSAMDLKLKSLPPKTVLTPGQKIERCRNCVIFNEHQRQKYSLWCGITLVGLPALFFLNEGWIMGHLGFIVNQLTAMTSRFEISAPTAAAAAAAAGSAPQATATPVLADVVMGCAGVIIISQLLRVVEYFCLKLKV